MIYGFHAPTGGKNGYLTALADAAHLKTNALQIFAKSPRAWTTRPLSSLEANRFREQRQKLGIVTGAVHASYLCNVGHPDPEIRQKSQQSLADDLEKAAALGLEYVVLHPGKGNFDDIRKGILNATLIANNQVRILLENTAGKPFDHLKTLGELIAGSPVGVCFDTAHAFAAGYPIGEDPKGVLDQLKEFIGLEAIPVIHLNDSAVEKGSGVDRHADLGTGKMGNSLRYFVLDPLLRDKAFIMETPRDPIHDASNLSVLRAWLGEA